MTRVVMMTAAFGFLILLAESALVKANNFSVSRVAARKPCEGYPHWAVQQFTTPNGVNMEVCDYWTCTIVDGKGVAMMSASNVPMCCCDHNCKKGVDCKKGLDPTVAPAATPAFLEKLIDPNHSTQGNCL
jgi:hypothetical protein